MFYLFGIAIRFELAKSWCWQITDKSGEAHVTWFAVITATREEGSKSLFKIVLAPLMITIGWRNRQQATNPEA